MASSRGRWRTALNGALVGLVLALPLNAFAEPTAEQKETARELMHTGDKKMNAGEHEAALEAYLAANELVSVPTTMLAVARAQAKTGQLVEALDMLGRVRRHPKKENEPQAFAKARRAAVKLENDLLARVPTIRITVEGPAPETPVVLRVDGVDIERAAAKSLRVNPGKRVVAASAPGYFEGTTTVELAEGQAETVSLVLEVDPSFKKALPDAPAASVPSRADEEGMDWSPYMYAGFGVGGAALVVGMATGIVALQRTSELEERCGGTRCPQELESEHDEIETLANVSNASFVIAALGAGLGIVTLVLDLQGSDDDASDAVSARLLIGPGSIGVGGQF